MGSPARLVFGTLDLPDTALAPRLLDRFHAGGGRALDVANVYRDGEAARAAGRWLRSRPSADGVVVYAKGCTRRTAARIWWARRWTGRAACSACSGSTCSCSTAT